MRNLLNFLAKYNNLIIFLLLESIAISLIVNGNSYHNSRFIKNVGFITNGIEEKITRIRSYFRLNQINQALVWENASLKNSIEKLIREDDNIFFFVSDTVYRQQYTFTSAKVIENSINRQKNFFTINRGLKHGLSAGMAVTTGNNVAGVILGCSDNYSVAMSLLNIDFRLSARIRSNGYFGSLSWDGTDTRVAVLNEIPQHVTFGIGDTVETTGYSALFPEGILIGTIRDFKRSGSDFYRIDVALATDFRKLYYINAIGNMRKQEQTELQNQFQ